jgi:dGTP triphosphohydrolase
VVRAADLFAYGCHDLDDAFLLGSLRKADVPRNVARVLGDAPSEIRGALVGTTVRYSVDHGDLALAPETAAALLSLRSFLYERLYEGPRIAAQTARVRSLFESVWEAFCERPRQWARVVSAGRWATALPIEPRDEVSAEAAAPSIDGFPDVMAVSFFVDTIAAMTDRQVLRLGRDLKVPRRVRSWPEGFAV